MFIFQGDNDSTIEEVRSDTFDVNWYFYTKEEFDDAVEFIYWMPPLYDIWIYEHVCRDHNQELAHHQKGT